MNTEALTERRALHYLRDVAETVPGDRCIVELGVFRGGSLKYLVEGAQKINYPVVYGVDTWGMRAVFWGWPLAWKYVKNGNKAEARRTAKGAILIQDYTVHAGRNWKGPKVGLLYIDADHRKSACLADFDAWLPHLAYGAMVAFDDYDTAGVKSAINRLVRQGLIGKPVIIGSRLAVTRLAVGF